MEIMHKKVTLLQYLVTSAERRHSKSSENLEVENEKSVIDIHKKDKRTKIIYSMYILPLCMKCYISNFINANGTYLSHHKSFWDIHAPLFVLKAA